MTNDSPTDDRTAVDSASFEEWLEQAAESEGVPKQELMNQMLSSYWILNELTGLVGEAELEGGAGNRSGAADPPREPQPEPSQDERGTDTGMEDPDDRPSDDSSTEESIREIHAAIQQLVESQSADDGENAPDAAPTLDGGVVSVVSDLQRQVGSFQSKLDDIEDQQGSQFERFSNELQLLIDRVNELEGRQDRFVERTELDSLTGDLRELNDQVEELRRANGELESRMDREFDSIEELFRRLLNELDGLDSELDTATESVRDDLESLQEREAERERLAELKTEAMSRGIRHGSCASCDQRIDLALLEAPECPNCTARFVGLRDGGWNPFRSPTIEAERPPIDDT
jgi:hypothetical protein